MEAGTAKEDSDPQPNALAVSRSMELSARFWLLLALTGLAAGLAGGLLMRLLKATQHIAWSYETGTLLAAAARSSPVQRVGVVLLAGAVVAVGVTALRFAKGGHSGELTAAIWFHAGETPFVRTIGRAVLSIVVVGMGAAVGREGALKQTGAAVGWKLADLVRLTPPQRRLLTACGAGAGMAAAYNIPLGGALFALEVLLGSISLPFAVPALACSMLATAVSWLLLPMTPTYVTPSYVLSPTQIAWAVAAGPVIGLFSLGYVRLIAWADTSRPKSLAGAVATPIAAFLALGLASLALPQLLGNGLDVVQQGFLGQVGALPLVLSLIILRPLATAICLRSGAPGGLFTPTMTAGALVGEALGDAWNRLAPGWAMHEGSCAVIGAGALLAASTEGPVSAVVSIIELGQHIDFLIVPLGVSVAGAMIVVRLGGGPSIYSARLRHGAKPVEKQPLPASALAAGVSADFLDVSAAARPAVAVQALLTAEQRQPPLPVIVVDEASRPVGRLSRRRIRSHDQARQPLELVTSGDLAQPVGVIALAQLQRPGGPEALAADVWSVVDGDDGPLVGVLDRRAPEA